MIHNNNNGSGSSGSKNQFRANVEFYEKPRQLVILGGMMMVMCYLGYANQSDDVVSI